MPDINLTETGPRDWCEEDEPSSLYLSSDCPSCGEEVPAPMGTLGNLNHYRCQCCGWQWAEKAGETQ